MNTVGERLAIYQREEAFFKGWQLKEGGLLGAGSFSEVYEIENSAEKREAALKVIPLPKDEEWLRKSKANNGNDMEQVRRELIKLRAQVQSEIDIMQQLRGSQNIVQIEAYHIIDRKDTSFGWDILIRMEKLMRLDHFLKGDMLKKLGYKLNKELIIKIWADILIGLDECGRKNIVHLDIKPENIFCTVENKLSFKLGDFGVSVHGRLGEDEQRGTLLYMAPEVLKSKGADRRADIYSLALIIYQLFNDNCVPFSQVPGSVLADDERDSVIAQRKVRKTVPILRKLDTPTMDRIRKALAYEPDERYSSAAEAYNDLLTIANKSGGVKMLPIVLAVASVGIAGALVILGMGLSSDQGEQAEEFSPTRVVEAVTQMPQSTQQIVQTQVPTYSPTPVPEGSMTSDGIILFAALNADEALGYIQAQIEGNVFAYLKINGENAGIYRIGDEGRSLPRASITWPKDGWYFLIEDAGSQSTQVIDLQCTSENGKTLFEQQLQFHWTTDANGVRMIAVGEAPKVRTEILIREHGFERTAEDVAKGGQTYSYTGTAEAGAAVVIYLNGQAVDTVQVDEQGNWTAVLPETALSQEIDCHISLSYEGEEAIYKESFTYDGKVSDLSMLSAYRQDDEKLIGMTEPNAQVEVLVYANNEWRTAVTGTADRNGEFVLEMNQSGLKKGDQYILKAVDTAGNQLTYEFIVEKKAVFALIELNEVNRQLMPDTEITLSGFAEAGERIGVAWDAEDAVYTVVDASGAFEMKIKTPAQNSGSSILHVFYEEEPTQGIEKEFTIDGICELQCENGITEDSQKISLKAEPGAAGRIWLNDDENNFVEFTVSDSGRCEAEISMFELSVGAVLNVYAVDVAGNVAQIQVSIELGDYSPIEMQTFAWEDAGELVIDSMVEGRSGAAVRIIAAYQNTPVDETVMQLSDDGRLDYRYDVAAGGYGDGEYTFTACYVNVPEVMVEKSVAIDTTAPALNVNHSLFSGKQVISGTTDAWVKLLVYSESGLISETTADGQGAFSFEEYDYPVGNYRIDAVDDNGNIMQYWYSLRKVVAAQFDRSMLGRGMGERYVLNGSAEQLTISGTAEVGSQIMLSLDGQVVGDAWTNESGYWTANISIGQLTQNKAMKLQVGIDGEFTDQLEVFYDPSCVLQINQMLWENSRSIQGTTDANAVVWLYRGEREAASAQADANGYFEIDLSRLAQPLAIGENVVVYAEDSAQNQAAYEMTVGKVVRTDVTTYVESLWNGNYLNADIFKNNREMRISGQAESGSELQIRIFKGAELIDSYSSSADRNGSYTVKASMPRSGDGEYTVEVQYADGLSKESGMQWGFFVDTEAPKLEIDQSVLDEVAESVSGVSEPNQEIVLTVNGKVVKTTSAKADGSFSIKNIYLEENDRVVVSATDAAGNLTAVERVVVAALPSAAGEITLDRMQYAQGDMLRIQGWMLYNSSYSAYVQILNGEEVVHRKALPDMQAMTQEEFNRNMIGREQKLFADSGVWIDYELPIEDWAGYGGDFSVRIMVDSYPDRSYVDASNGFTVQQGTAVDLQTTPYVTERYAIGFDAEQPAAEYDADSILLTGWFYGGAEESYGVDFVYYAPEMRTDDRTEIELETIFDIAMLPQVQGIYYVDRDVISACPEEVKGMLPAIIPTDRAAGFIINLKLGNIPDGNYVVTLVSRFDGPYEETATITIQIKDGTAEIHPQDVENISLKWMTELVLKNSGEQ